jgi:predicted enzyme related to lactoylglutathione lyase
MTRHISSFVPGLAVALIAIAVLGRLTDLRAQGNARPVLVNTCLITKNVEQLVAFYEPVLQIKASRSGADYAEFLTSGGVLAIFAAEAQERYIPHSADPGNNKSVIVEFRVADVDQEYRRLQGLVSTWVKPPTTQPWGTRSIYFRDPDGNLVDFFVTGKKH